MTIPDSSTSMSSPLPAKRFGISPLIRGTLLLLYVALTLPLPTLATVTQAPVQPEWLGLAIAVGGVAIYGGLSEQVYVDDVGIQVRYPRWVVWGLRRSWSLSWQTVTALKPRSTGQGGLVYYFTGHHNQAYLLPMRVAGFAELLRYVEAYTSIDTQDVKPLAQPWMYIILLGFSGLLLFVDGWTLWMAAHLPGVS